MILTVENTAGKKVQVKDITGKVIHGVCRFNTRTCEVEFYAITVMKTPSGAKIPTYIIQEKAKKRSVVKVKARIPGAYAEINGKKVRK